MTNNEIASINGIGSETTAFPLVTRNAGRIPLEHSAVCQYINFGRKKKKNSTCSHRFALLTSSRATSSLFR